MKSVKNIMEGLYQPIRIRTFVSSEIIDFVNLK